MSLMLHSIQEYLKKNNRQITSITFIGLGITILIFSGSIFYILNHKTYPDTPVSYTKLESEKLGVKSKNTRPFASINGKTYTFDWCQGSNIIAEKNKIYFVDEISAEKSGRTLSKLCLPR